jgi:hypothetical protein
MGPTLSEPTLLMENGLGYARIAMLINRAYRLGLRLGLSSKRVEHPCTASNPERTTAGACHDAAPASHPDRS